MAAARKQGLVAGIRALAAVLACTIALATCGSRRDASSAGDPDAIREAIERRLEEPMATEPPTTTIDAATTTAWTGRAVQPGVAPLFLEAADIAGVYTRNGPIPFDPIEISEADTIVMQTACELLATAANETETLLVYDSFEVWFDDQLIETGAPPEYIDAWDPRGMLGSLVKIGCSPPSTSPGTGDLG